MASGRAARSALKIVVGVVEIDIAVDGRLVVDDVHLGGRHAVLGEPLERVVHGEVRLGRDDHDSMSFGQLFERLDRTVVRLEDAEDARPVAARAGPRPELAHVGEVGEERRRIPDVDVLGEQVGAELIVVPGDPPGVEVGDDAVEVDPQSQPVRGLDLSAMADHSGRLEPCSTTCGCCR